MTGSYDLSLVVLSVIIAVLSSYTAIGFAARLSSHRMGGRPRLWLVGGAVALGCGIWAMHFIGMLAYNMDVPVSYRVDLSFLSLLMAILISAAALYVPTHQSMNGRRLGLSALLMGLGISAMHYLGMAAMIMPARIDYNGLLVFASILIAIAASAGALQFIFRLQHAQIGIQMRSKLLASAAMGLAIAGMHYTGMAAASFSPVAGMTGSALALDPHYLGMIVTILAIVIQVLGLEARTLDQLDSSREMEYRTRKIMETTLDGFWLVDAKDMRITEVNIVYCQMSGYAEHELTGMPIGELDANESADEVRLHGERIRRNGQAVFETCHRRKDGTTYHVEVSTKYSPELQVFAVFIRDISDRKRAEHDLARSEAKFRTVFNKVGDAIFITNTLGRVIEANQVAVTRLGYSRDALLAMHPEDFTSERYREGVATRLAQLRAGKTMVFETEHVTAKGQLIPVEVISSMVDFDGEAAFLSVARDVSERRKIEAEFRKLYQAVEQVSEAVIVSNRQGVIEYVNPAFTRINGYGPGEALGQRTNLFKSGKQPKSFYEDLWKTVSEGRAWKQPLINRRKDGSEYQALMSITPLRDEQGEITHFIALQQDMTEHNKLEQQLCQSQKMEALGTLVGGIAHDFNNVLAGMLGNLFLARRAVRNDPQLLHRIEGVEALGQRAAEMIKQLLTFARADQVEMRVFGLTTFLKETAKLNQASIPENIKLEYDLPDQNLMIHGDATQLHQVIMNLLVNARDAVRDRLKPKIRIALSEFNPDAEFMKEHQISYRYLALLRVSDNGEGIAAEHVAQIFDPFFTTKEVGRGTGLGLSMVYGAIQMHSGVIEVESEPGHGTSFNIYLPLVKEESLPDEAEADEQIISGQGELILLVDDDASVCEVGRHVLEGLGYRVITASNGAESVVVFAEHRHEIALVLMDLVMPVMGGVKASEMILDLNPNVHVVFVTGYDRDASLQEHALLAQQIVLSKPYRAEELSRVVYHCIHER